MKVISIIQPWATLIVLGEKKFETRSWATKHRGELAIHAGKKIDKEACRREPIRSALAKQGYDEKNLPTGVILATCKLSNCHEIHIDHSGDAVLLAPNGAPEYWIGAGSNEFSFGFYDFGRFAWRMTDMKRLTVPIPAKGQLGLWNYKEDGIDE
jgi:activating signal cointegrator 1